MTLDRERKMALSQLNEVEGEIQDLLTEASMAINRLAAMIGDHELEKKRILREKTGNLNSLMDRHNKEIKRYVNSRELLETEKGSLRDLLEEIKILVVAAKKPGAETPDLMSQFEKLRGNFEQIASKIEVYKEIRDIK